MSEKLPKRPYYMDILNNDPGQFRVTARKIDSSVESFTQLRNSLELEHPGLYMHIGSWIDHVYAIGTGMGPEFTENAVNGYNKGALMTYGLLKRVAAENGQEIANPRFNPSDFVDTELGAKSDAGTLLNMSMRGKLLPQKFPIVFKSAMTMLGKEFNQPPGIIEKRVYGPPNTLDDVEITFFLTGVAEVILPLERYAEVQWMNSSLGRE